jgi:purine-binding chemotaxis protein CheW
MPASAPEGRTSTPAEAAREHVLVFTVERREFTVPIDSVVEIVRHRAATPVPGTAPAVEGILPLRGHMVTLLDLRRCLNLPPRPAGAGARVIVVGPVDDRLGLVVDGVSGVVPLPTAIASLDIGALLRGMS